jgi:hypothetical protein
MHKGIRWFPETGYSERDHCPIGGSFPCTSSGVIAGYASGDLVPEHRPTVLELNDEQGSERESIGVPLLTTAGASWFSWLSDILGSVLS